jgi:outer membrane immunogenic protein
MTSLRSVLLSFAIPAYLAALSFSPAMAADLPSRKAPAPVAYERPAATNWNGFYFGAFAGGSLASDSQGYSVTSPLLASLPPIIPVVNAAGSSNLRSRGADVGVEAGYNWVVSPQFVLGVEGDMGWSSLRGSETTNGTVPLFLIPFSITQKIDVDWQSSLRLRAGFTPLDNLLVYATGGPAVAHIRYANTFWDSDNETESASVSALRAGWTIGGGAEWAFSRKWSLKGEYRYSQFSGVNAKGSTTLTDGSTTYIGHSSGPIRENSVRVGVEYHLD